MKIMFFFFAFSKLENIYFIRNNISTNLIKQCVFKIKNNLI